MSRENDAYQKVLSEVAEVVNEMYEKYRRGKILEETNDTERQLDILTSKKYISITYISDLSLIADYYAKEQTAKYEAKLLEYKTRIRVQTESIPY